jgi:serine protease AprX
VVERAARTIKPPCDDNGHGTHTTGTTIGDDGAGNQVGVAPGAQWIGCRNMDQGNGTPATYTECFQFFIAPTDLNGQNPNPALRPHVMNNSWGCPVSEGCTTRAELEQIVNNTQAAGIFVEVSAGNAGPGCSSINDPPAIYEASFSTGVIDISNTLARLQQPRAEQLLCSRAAKAEYFGAGGQRALLHTHQRH